MRGVLHQYKFMSATWFEPFLMRVFLQSAIPALRNGGWDGIVPAPLHPVKFRERGFNQSDRLALGLAGQLQVPLMNTVLSRVKFTQPQSALPRAGRFVNVREAFQANKDVRLSGKKLVLVDDVMTTGATVNACARALKKAGVFKVAVWTLARGGLSADLT
jgi:ComF family protein